MACLANPDDLFHFISLVFPFSSFFTFFSSLHGLYGCFVLQSFSLGAMNKGGRAALARSKSIDHQIDEDRERRQREVQLLILGKSIVSELVL